ncbi:MAG: MFS transporter [Clostridia bacterium]|nr:MFS transporter [Clostridia bacterium]
MSRENRRAAGIILIAWLAYLISYIGRSDYSACLLTIIEETGFSRAAAGSVSSAFALCNAFGQLVSGFAMKKLDAKKVIAIELFAVAFINFLFPEATSIPVMAVLWGVNGFLQSTLLCGVTQIFAETLKEPRLSRGAVAMNTIGAVGGLFNYVFAYFMIRYLCWQSVFFTVSVLLLLLGIVWCVWMPRLTKRKEKSTPAPTPAAEKATPSRTPLFKQLFAHGTVFVIAGAGCVGLLRESVSLWIPSFVNDVFALGESTSIIVTVFVPCMQITGAILGGRLGRSAANLQFLSAGAFALSGVCLLTIMLCGSASLILTLILFVINAVSMTAALTFLLSLFPIRHFARTEVALLVGIINFSVHAGDFLSSFSIGLLSEQLGWGATFTALGAIALLASLLLLTGGYFYRKEVKKRAEA